MGSPRARSALSVPLLRRGGRHRPLAARVAPRLLRHQRSRRRVHRQRCPRPHRVARARAPSRRRFDDASPRLLRVTEARGLHGQRFNDAGIASVALDANTPSEQRTKALRQLRDGNLQIIFAVDLFNEGLDVPHVDTVLFLRPTESATVFLQQLGRGLRHAPGKACLTVLDFIGQQHRRFRFDVRYRALTGVARSALPKTIEDGFPFLPSGCHIELDRVATRTVLDNLKSQLRLNRKQLADELRTYGDLSLSAYLAESGRELADIYRSQGSLTTLRRAAGLPLLSPGESEDALLRRVHRFASVDDLERVRTWSQWLRKLAATDPRRPAEATATACRDVVLHLLAGRRWFRPSRTDCAPLATPCCEGRSRPAVGPRR